MEEFKDIITAAKPGQSPFYTNSSHLPVSYTNDIFQALEMEDDLQVLYTSGTVFHAFLGERIPDWKSAASLVKKIASNFKLPYFTLSPTYSVCPEHGYIQGEHFTCPVCGHEAEVYSRITGYYRPVRNWNDGKAAEFASRKTYEPEELSGRETPDSCIHTTVGKGNVAETPSFHAEEEHPRKKMILITTKTCPNCKSAKNYLNEKGVDYEVVLADEEEGANIARKYNIMQAPTLIVPDEMDDGVKLYENVSSIRSFLDEK